MKKTIFLSFSSIMLIVLNTLGLKAQSITPDVVSPAGGDFNNASFGVSYTFGELTAVKTMGTTSIITQGMHQPPNTLTTNISDASNLEGVFVYPNPSHGLLTLEISQASSENYHYYIYNLLGEVVAEESVTIGLSKIDISKMETGIYFIKIKGTITNKGKTIKITILS